VTAGASAPELLVTQVVDRLRALGARAVVERSGVVERIVFPMPKGLGPKPGE
jgi:4-hydroxy-3-methylbut-2-enyl diphosphate reductase